MNDTPDYSYEYGDGPATYGARLRRVEQKQAAQDVQLRDLVKAWEGMRRAFYTLAISIIGAAVIFAFSVLTLHK